MGNKKYLIVGTDYFTKWVEAEPQLIFEMWMQKDSSGKALLLDLVSLMCLSRIIDSSSIARCLEIIVANWRLQTDILLRLTPKGMDRLK